MSNHVKDRQILTLFYILFTLILFTKPLIAKGEISVISNTISQEQQDEKHIVLINKKSAFASQLCQPNTVYVIRFNIDLKDSDGKRSITIPPGCILKFEGGSINNGLLVGNNTRVDSRRRKIFGDNLLLSGTWDAQEAYPEWFGAKGNAKIDNTIAFQNVINFFPLIVLRPETYVCNSEVFVGSNRTIIGNNTRIRCKDEGHNQFVVNGNKTSFKGITFENVAKGYPKYGYDNGGVNSTNLVYKSNIEGITIGDCTFKNAICGIYVHSACKDIVIKGCVFDGFKSLPNNHASTTTQCAGGYGICLDADNSDLQDIDNIYSVTISNCTFRNIQRHCLYIQCVYNINVEQCYFYANRNIVHPTPYDAVMMIYNTVGLRVTNNEFHDALEAMHLEKIGKLPYNPNDLKDIIINGNLFSNCGDEIGENGVIGADYGDDICITNNSFVNVRGQMGAIIGLNHNNNVSIINNYCDISKDCPMNSNVVKYNSSDIYNVSLVGNKVDFTNTRKNYDKLIYTEFRADGLEVRDNDIINGNDGNLIMVPNIKNKNISRNKQVMKR